MGKIIIYYYSGNCYFSEEAKKIGTDLSKIPDMNIQLELYPIERRDSLTIDKLKKKYNHNTFPIILYHNTKNEDLLVGGHSDFLSIIDFVRNNKNLNLQDYKKSIIQNNGKSNGKLRLTYYLLKKLSKKSTLN